jgi:hypothetical protein
MTFLKAVAEKSAFEGGRGMTNSNYETKRTTIANSRNSPLGRGRGGLIVNYTTIAVA